MPQPIQAQPQQTDSVAIQVTIAKRELIRVNRTIVERQTYFKQQEVTIADHTEAGNLALRGLEYEITQARQTLRDTKTELRTLRGDKQLLEADMDRMRQEFTAEMAEMEVQKTAMENQLVQAQDALMLVDLNRRTVAA